ncbi:MAG TPA: glycosyltransferase [Acetobacteraceae bacterium]|nr:glycosyltransferase [Acetobacteraceae bacterium]
MKFLFVHQNFPGQYLHVINHLLASGRHEIVFVSQPNKTAIPGVRRVFYEGPKTAPNGIHPNVRDHELAARRAESVARVANNLKRLGFTPDIIIGHHGWGELLDLPAVWPGVPVLGYFEFYYRSNGQDVGFDPEFPVDERLLSRINAMNTINLLALSLEQHGHTPTRWQLERYPDWARGNIKLLPEGALLDVCKPDPKAHGSTLEIGDFRVTPKDRLVTYVARNLEPYRGFHTMMRALPALLKARRDVKVVMVGGDDVSYGARLANTTWREHFQREQAGKYDASRVLFPGQVPYAQYLRLLQRSDCHVYLSYPFVASWSLREAMAAGCAIVAADVEPVREFITDGRTGLLASCLDPARLAERVQTLLEDTTLNARLRAAARRHAVRHLDMKQHVEAFEVRIAEITGLRLR